jgi:hypothetical protein
MNKLPGVTLTYKRVFDLIRLSYLLLAPVVILFTLCQYTINFLIPIHLNLLSNALISIVLQLTVICLFFSVMISILYQQFYRLKRELIKTLEIALMRSIQLFVSILILASPSILFACILYGIAILNIVSLKILYGIFIFILLINFCLFVYASLSSVFIINQKSGIIDGFKQSYTLVRGYWVETAFLIFVFIVLLWILIWVSALIFGYRAPLSITLVYFFTTPIWAGLMILHGYHLQNAHQGNNDE